MKELVTLSRVSDVAAQPLLGAGGSSACSPATGSGLSGCHTICSRMPDMTLASILSGNNQAASASRVAVARATRPPVKYQCDLDIAKCAIARKATRFGTFRCLRPGVPSLYFEQMMLRAKLPQSLACFFVH